MQLHIYIDNLKVGIHHLINLAALQRAEVMDLSTKIRYEKRLGKGCQFALEHKPAKAIREMKKSLIEKG